MVNEYKAILLAEEKAAADGRVFGDEYQAIAKNIVCLVRDSKNLPTLWNEIMGLNECVIAPGSIAIHPESKSTFIFSSKWNLWSGGSDSTLDTSSGGEEIS